MRKSVLDTAPVNKPLTVDGDNGLKDHLNLDQDFTTDDDYLEDLIDVAVDHLQELTGRKLITQTWLHYLNDWPDCDEIVLPFGQLQSITHIKYTDTAGSQSTWSSSEYIADTDSDPGRVVIEWGYTWPSTVLYPSNPIEIKFVCGYGDDGDDVPANLRQAAKILVGEMFENREMTVMGISIAKNDFVYNLIDQYRLYEL